MSSMAAAVHPVVSEVMRTLTVILHHMRIQKVLVQEELNLKTNSKAAHLTTSVENLAEKKTFAKIIDLRSSKTKVSSSPHPHAPRVMTGAVVNGSVRQAAYSEPTGEVWVPPMRLMQGKFLHE